MSSSLGRQLWDKYEELRTNNMIGFLTDEEFQKYFLGFIAYKYLSENLELYLENKLNNEISFEDAYNSDVYKSALEREAIYNLGYFLTPEYLFRNIVSSKNYGKIILDELNIAFTQISSSSVGTESQEDFENLFENVNLYASQLGKTEKEKNKVVFNILEKLDSVDFQLNEYNSSLSNKYSLVPNSPFNDPNFLREISLETPVIKQKNMFLNNEPILADNLNERPLFKSDELLDLKSNSFHDDSIEMDYYEMDSPKLAKNDLMMDSPNFLSKSAPHISKLKNKSIFTSSQAKIMKQYSIGDAFEYLLDKFSYHNSKSGDYFTPNDISLLVSKLVETSTDHIKRVYDPCCGSASLLLELNKNIPCDLICGQEINAYYYNIARENMILHNIHYRDFDIKQGDSLENPQHEKYENFDVIVSQIPFNAKWNPNKSLLEDDRFKEFNVLAPRVKAEYAFIQHMLSYLDKNGIMVIVAPHGVLFRAASESAIRKIIVGSMNYLDAVIGLPSNMFYSTNSPSCILIFKKNRPFNMDDVLFIDASNDFDKIKLRNNLRKVDMDKIVNTYVNRLEIDKYSHRAHFEEILDNDFNLNIPRYVDTYEHEKIDTDAIYKRREEVSKELKEVTEEINALCNELNIENPLNGSK